MTASTGSIGWAIGWAPGWATWQLGAAFGPPACAFLAAWALARRLTPAIARGAQALGIVDRPDGRLKRQAARVPYLGGMAVYLAFLLAVSAVFALNHALLALLLGGTLLAMLGLFDDLHALSPRMKLLGQGLGCYVLLRAGICIQLTFVPTALAMATSVLWLLSVTNAVNVLDVSDGLASGVAAAAAAGLAVLAWGEGQGELSVMSLALAGSLLGFLPFNVWPARVYLGDTGSLFVGYVLAALTLQASYTEQHPWAAMCPPILLTVPLLDLGVVSLVRLSRGHSPMRGSPDHVALLLRQRGWSVRKVAWTAWGTSWACAGLACGVAHAPKAVSLALLAGWAVAASCSAALFVRWGMRRALTQNGHPAASCEVPVGDQLPA